ncbi:MAG: phosphoglucosamine mutase [Oscillospiraceae bacterium]|nr:phosphoglucosamine mutase [Oscillospiraceae bacterium]
MGKYFGTDGIRGIVNKGLDAALAFRVGQATAMVLSEEKGGGRRPFVTIGKDTRISGDMLEAAITAGLCSAGADVMALGVIPTPAVAFITTDCGADAGIVISASHNPFEHNGIKIFNSRGFKLSDELENKIERLIDSDELLPEKQYGDIGRVLNRGHECVDRYVEHIVSVSEGHIGKLKVMIDCSNGAAARTVSDIFGRFPLNLELIKDHPNGCNINDNCGSTHIEGLGRMVVAGGFDLGIAFDGDADRCLAVDENGQLVDGDKIMAICGKAMAAEGKLKKNAIVATVMSNLGFHEYCASNGIDLHCAAVGDRNVLEMMIENDFNLGGEQSGHMIFLDYATTGDGQLAAVRFLDVLSRSGRKLSELASEIPTYPQVLRNISIEGGNAVKERIMSDEGLKMMIDSEQRALGTTGRILVRPSGTEALIRIMVEAADHKTLEEVAFRLSSRIDSMSKNMRM